MAKADDLKTGSGAKTSLRPVVKPTLAPLKAEPSPHHDPVAAPEPAPIVPVVEAPVAATPAPAPKSPGMELLDTARDISRIEGVVLVGEIHAFGKRIDYRERYLGIKADATDAGELAIKTAAGYEIIRQTDGRIVRRRGLPQGVKVAFWRRTVPGTPSTPEATGFWETPIEFMDDDKAHMSGLVPLREWGTWKRERHKL